MGKDGRVTVVRRYLQTRLLGKGGFAKCYKFTGLDRHNHKKVFAGKVVVKSSLKKKSAREKVRVRPLPAPDRPGARCCTPMRCRRACLHSPVRSCA